MTTSSPISRIDLVPKSPISRARGVAEYRWRSRFWIAIDRPNVATIWYAGSTATSRSNTRRWPTTPATAATGMTTRRARNGFHVALSTIVDAPNAAATARSPWARLTSRITPNAIDRPVA
jgi:hypothetical protein